MIEIKRKEKIMYATPINEGSVRKYTLMSEDYISLKFKLENPIYFNIGDTIKDGLFEIVDLVEPDYNDDSGVFDYEVRFDAYYWKWKNKMFFFNPRFGGIEPNWSLTSTLATHLGVILRNLEYLGYTFNGMPFEFNIDSTVQDGSKFINYDSVNIIDALTLIAQEFDCEWWITDNVINFGKCEYGTGVDFRLNDNVDTMSRSKGRDNYATRIYAFGSTRNIPQDYRPNADVISNISEKRLMLPKGISYVDAYPNMTQEEAVEGIIVLDDIFPSMENEITSVRQKELNTDEGKLWTYWIKGNLEFSTEWVIDDLLIHFESGSLGGMQFKVLYDNSTKEFTINRSEEYGEVLPNDILKPKTGDKFTLSGYNTKYVGEHLLEDAEQKLLDETKKYVEQSKIDPSVYDCTMMSDYMFNGGNFRTFEIGDKVNIINPAFFSDKRESRIIGYEYDLAEPFNSPIYSVGKTAPYSILGDLRDKVDELIYKEKVFQATGTGVYVIGQYDSTTPTDRNVFSAKKSLNAFHRKDQTDSTDYLQKFNKGAEFGDYKNKKGAYINEEGKADFNEVQSNKVTTKDLVATNTKTTNLEADVSTLKKATINDLVAQLANIHNLTVEDTANILRAVVGSVSSEQFKSGFGGEGFRIYEAINGDWNLEIDNVIVRKVFSVFELIVQKITHQGGMVINSPNGAKITKVTDGGSYWKCEHDSATDFFKDDQILCQNFTGTNIKRYWRLATNAGKGYVNLSKTDQEANSAIPQEGDEIVVLGNRTNINRQSAIIVSTIGDNSPHTAYLSKINSYSLAGKENTRSGNLNGIVDKDFGALKGNGLYSENVYLKGIFRLTNGKNVETVISENKLDSDNRIEETKLKLGSEIDRANALAKNAQDSVDGLEIGGRNYIKSFTNSDWKIHSRVTIISERELVHVGNTGQGGVNRSTLIIELSDAGAYTISGYTKGSPDATVVLRPIGGVGVQQTLYLKDSENYEFFKHTFALKEPVKYELEIGGKDLPTDGLYFKELKLEKGNKPTDWSPAPEDQQAELTKQITNVRTDFQITEGQINGKLQETTQLLTESKTLSGETKQTLESTTARVNEFNLTAKKFEGTLGEITKKQGEVEGSILNVQATANSLQASITGFKETEREIKDTATRIEATHEGIVLEASEKSAQKAIDGLEIGGRNLMVYKDLRGGSIKHESGIGSPLNGYLTANPKYQGGHKMAVIDISDRLHDNIIINPIASDYHFLRYGFYTDNPIGDNVEIGEYNGEDVYMASGIFIKESGRLITGNITKNIVLNIPEDAKYFVFSSDARPSVGVRDWGAKWKIEYGNKATDWSPAPEDYDAKFTETNASLKVLADQISSEVSKTNGIRTDLTTLSQSHNSFKAQVKSDISGAIDSNNEVIKSSFEMKDNVITMIGKRVNVLAELKVGSNTLIKDGFINTGLIKTDELVSKRVKTANSGPRFEMEGSEMKVYGDGAHPNMVFGVNKDGYAVMEYYTPSGEKLYDLGPSGINMLNFAPAKWTEKKLKQFSTAKSRENLRLRDFLEIVDGNVTQTNAPIYYNYYAGGSPTVSQAEREREKYTYASINGPKIADGWYYTPPSSNSRGYMQYPSNNSGKFMKPEEGGLYHDSSGVLDRDNIYIVKCHLYIGGILTDSANYYFQENPK